MDLISAYLSCKISIIIIKVIIKPHGLHSAPSSPSEEESVDDSRRPRCSLDVLQSAELLSCLCEGGEGGEGGEGLTVVRYAHHCVCYVESFQMSGNIMGLACVRMVMV